MDTIGERTTDENVTTENRESSALEVKWDGIWKRLAGRDEIPDELVEIGRELATSMVGEGCMINLRRPRGDDPETLRFELDEWDTDLTMSVRAGRLAGAWLCHWAMHDGPLLNSYSFRIVATVVEQIRRNLHEIVLLGWILRSTGVDSINDVPLWAEKG